MRFHRSMRLVIAGCFVFIASAPAYGTSWTWISLISEASKNVNAGNVAKAEEGFRKALEEARRSCGEECRATMLTLSLLGQVVGSRGRFRESEELFRRAFVILEKSQGPEHHETGGMLGGIGVSMTQQGKLAEGEALLRRGLSIVEKAKGPDFLGTAIMLSNLVFASGGQGKLAEAERHARRAVAILEKTGDIDTRHAPAVLGSLAAVLSSQGGYEEAERLQRRSLETLERHTSAGHPDAPLYLSGIAAALEGQGKLAEAEAYYRKALLLAEKTRGPESDVTLPGIAALAHALILQAKGAEAEPLSRRAHALSVKLHGEEHDLNSAILNDLGAALEQRNDHAGAEASFRQAVAIGRKSAKPEYLLKQTRDLGYFLALHGKPGEALPYYREALQILDLLFTQTRGLREEARQGFLARHSHYYREAIELLLRLHQMEPKGGHDREALAVASRDQSRIFTELLRQADVAKFAAEPNFISLKQRRDALLDQIAALRAASGKAPLTGGDAAALRANLAEEAKKIEAELRATEEALANAYPRYAELVQPKPVTVEELQTRLLRPDEALVVFVLLPREAAIFALTKERFALEVRPITRDSVTAAVRAARRGVEQVGAGDSLLALKGLDPAGLHVLYRELIAPVEDVLKDRKLVLVVGDGPLNTFPLESLVVRFGDSERQAFESAAKAADGTAANPLLGEYSRLSYLGERVRFAYLPSLPALASQRLHSSPVPEFDQQLVSFADPVFTASEDSSGADRSANTRAALSVLGRSISGERGKAPALARLKETADEAREIAAIVGGKSSVYLREKAQERTAKSTDLRRTRYVHFATHGFLGGDFLAIKESLDQDRSGFFSLFRVRTPSPGAESAQPALALTLVGDLQGEDGFLTMKDVMEHVALSAELVLLSACNTAGEQEAAYNGEGFAGLTRAFMYAGARALIVSHWNVESNSAKELITETFRELKAGKPASSALDAARQKLRSSTFSINSRNVSRAHPYFWAPFVYVGD